MNDDQGPPIMPQPQAGIPPTQNLEVIAYMSDSDPFQTDEEGRIVDGSLDPELKRWFWGFVSKDVIWANLTLAEVRARQHAFLATRSLFLKNMSPRNLTHKIIFQLDQLQMYVFTRIGRSKEGFERNKMTEMTQQTLYGEANRQPQQTPGWGARIKNAFWG